MSFPVDEKYIVLAENDLNVRFPPSFRGKMTEMNGGEVRIGEDYFLLHPFFDTSDKRRLKRTCNSIVHETRKAHDYFHVPHDLIVIGNNGGGDLLVYKVDELNGGEAPVYWLDHENGDLNFVAKTFTQLVGKNV